MVLKSEKNGSAVLLYYVRTREPLDMLGESTDQARPEGHAGAIIIWISGSKPSYSQKTGFHVFAILLLNRGTYRLQGIYRVLADWA